MPIDKQIEIENERQHTTIKCAPRVWCMYRHRHQCRQPISINTWLRLAQDNYLNHFHRARWTLEHVFYPQNSNQKKNATKRKSNLISIHNQNTNTHTHEQKINQTQFHRNTNTQRETTQHIITECFLPMHMYPHQIVSIWFLFFRLFYRFCRCSVSLVLILHFPYVGFQDNLKYWQFSDNKEFSHFRLHVWFFSIFVLFFSWYPKLLQWCFDWKKNLSPYIQSRFDLYQWHEY